MKKKVCFTATIEFSIKAFLLDHIRALSSRYDVYIVTNTSDLNFLKPFGIDAKVIPVGIEREISLWRDIKALVHLIFLFRREKFDVVHSISPKSGLLTMLAGFFARIPIRVHTFTGQVWATRAGLMRLLLKNMDRLLTIFATNILVDSKSQKAFIVEQRIVYEEKAVVLANGSISGVDMKRFPPDPATRKDLRDRLGISESEVGFLYLGRLKEDKGVLDMAEAFSRVCSTHDSVHLVVVGPDEENMRSRMLDSCRSFSNRIYFEDYTNMPESYMASADVLCLPSYREGFGNVIIEAAAVGIPSIGTRIYGITDAIEEGVTGFLFEPGNVNELTVLMSDLIENADLRKKLGMNARERASRLFSKEMVVSAMLDYYESLLLR